MTPDLKCLVGACAEEMMRVQRSVLDEAWHDPDRCFEPVRLERQGKPAKLVDLFAEASLIAGLRRRLRDFAPLIVFGEESLGLQRDGLSNHKGLAILVDAVDGTRLLEYGWNDWCSAATVFSPATREIVASIVAFPSGVAYFATSEGVGKCRTKGRGIQFGLVSGRPSKVGRANASIAFYGYRMKRFAELGGRIARLVGTPQGVEDNPEIFVIGGNPALVHMVDGFKRIDAVVEPLGQAPHDMAAGAFICRQAGCTVIDLFGRDVALGELLFGPKTKVPFIAASNPELAEALRQELTGSPAGSTVKHPCVPMANRRRRLNERPKRTTRVPTAEGATQSQP